MVDLYNEGTCASGSSQHKCAFQSSWNIPAHIESIITQLAKALHFHLQEIARRGHLSLISATVRSARLGKVLAALTVDRALIRHSSKAKYRLEIER